MAPADRLRQPTRRKTRRYAWWGALTVAIALAAGVLVFASFGGAFSNVVEVTAKLPASLEILNPAPAQDSDAMTVTAATAAKYHLKSIADLKPYASSMVLGGPPEFKTRSDGIAGLKANYGLTFKSFDPLDESGPLTLAALADGKVQVADVFTTTPQIITNHLVSLSDPKANFAAQNVIPLVYKADSNATITSTLNTVSAALTTSALLQMDNAVITDKQNYSTVATAFLKTIGIS